jgi:hypothetical protein
MSLVIIESPLKGSVSSSVPNFLTHAAERVIRERNRHYAFAALRSVLGAGHAPYASHVFFDQPGLLEDSEPEQRRLGMTVGQLWSVAGDCRWSFEDRGVSSGMALGMAAADQLDQPVAQIFIEGYKRLPLWRCALAAALRWALAKVYGR